MRWSSPPSTSDVLFSNPTDVAMEMLACLPVDEDCRAGRIDGRRVPNGAPRYRRHRPPDRPHSHRRRCRSRHDERAPPRPDLWSSVALRHLNYGLSSGWSGARSPSWIKRLWPPHVGSSARGRAPEGPLARNSSSATGMCAIRSWAVRGPRAPVTSERRYRDPQPAAIGGGPEYRRGYASVRRWRRHIV